MRRHNESSDVLTDECTSGRELLTVVDLDNLTVVYSFFGQEYKLGCFQSLVVVFGQKRGRAWISKLMNARCLAVG